MRNASSIDISYGSGIVEVGIADTDRLSAAVVLTPEGGFLLPDLTRGRHRFDLTRLAHTPEGPPLPKGVQVRLEGRLNGRAFRLDPSATIVQVLPAGTRAESTATTFRLLDE